MIEYKLQIEPEDSPLWGNLARTDDVALDTLYENEIMNRIESGDDWAWCRVHVTAQIGQSSFLPDIRLTGDAYLGGCTYGNESQFRESPCFEDMKAEALENLLTQLRAASVAYAEISEQIK